ncbi:MAG: hypothetical protein WBF24_17735 [Xanthobacteraceae bacterium]
MASPRKIAANRRNAARSTGPRGEAAKRRTRRNAVRHGFASKTTFDADLLARIEIVARELVGVEDDPVSLELARTIARTQLDLEQIYRLKISLIETIASSMAMAGMPSEMPLDSAAMLRAMPHLININRYERRAAGRRDRAVRELMARRSA